MEPANDTVSILYSIGSQTGVREPPGVHRALAGVSVNNSAIK